MNHRPDTDMEALQRTYLQRHAIICSGQVLAPRSATMDKRQRQLIDRWSRKQGFPVYERIL